ncbi:transporter substrate-binding domain-containing diguanylate cyclase [Psychromonas hadalis]|uniref:transporter substrate-binding domain-containing diguanylate cyclase n=1 Tax=Psychromonas hadalis TaxID=211669 RepID=UPI0003B6F604|nr:transporter substrate-binding domain-containing protein [Psychromonas hadalis]
MIAVIFIRLSRASLFLLLSLLSLTPIALASDLDLTLDERNYIELNPVIKVHAEKSWRPFNFIENNEVKGYSNDLMRLVAKNVGLEIDFVVGYHWNDYLMMLKNGEIDVITNMKRTPEREKYAIFTQYKPLKAINGLLTFDETSHYLDFNSLKNKNVAVVRGFFYEELMRTHFPDINVLLTNSTEESVEQLVLGHVDAVLDSYAVINFYIQRYFITGVTNAPLFENTVFNHLAQYMGVNKSNPILRNILDKGLHKITEDQLVKLQQKWSLMENKDSQFVDTSFQQIMPMFSESEHHYLKSKTVLKMCVDPDWLPIEGIRHGVYTGMGADFVHLFEQRLPTPIKLIQTESWPQTLRYMKQGLCDFIPIISRTEQRDNFLVFTYPYLRFPLVLVTKKERLVHKLEQVLHRPIGVVKDTSYKEAFEKNYPQGDLREYTSAAAGLQAVKSGEIYAFIDSLPVIAKHIKQNHPELKIVDKIDYQHTLSLATSLLDPVLMDIFNKVIATISVQQHEEIVNRWSPLIYETKEDLTWLWAVLIVIMILFLLLIFRNQVLKKSNFKLQKMQNKLEALAMRDVLTGLPNQHYFIEQLDKEWARANRSLQPLSVVMFDIDHFKKFNDKYGRLAGDRCLIEFSRRLQVTIKRPADLLARYSGEEFVLILPETNEKGVEAIVVELFKLLEQWALQHSDSPCCKILTVSAGAATLKYNSKYGAEELIRRADNALYKAQQNGHKQLVQYQKKSSD